MKDMEKQRSVYAPDKFAPLVDEVPISPEERLGRFFNLLLQIDKRNNRELYKSRSNPDENFLAERKQI